MSESVKPIPYWQDWRQTTELLRTMFNCSLLVIVSVLIVRRDLIPVDLRPHLPKQLEPYTAAEERVRQGYVVFLTVASVVAYQFKGGWMHAKEA